jgi:hypothetical protein
MLEQDDAMEKFYFKTTGWDNGTCTENDKLNCVYAVLASVINILLII